MATQNLFDHVQRPSVMKLNPQVPLFKLVSDALIQNPTVAIGFKDYGDEVHWFDAGHRLMRVVEVKHDAVDSFIFDALVREKRVPVTVTSLTLDEYNALAKERGVHEAVSLEQACERESMAGGW